MFTLPVAIQEDEWGYLWKTRAEKLFQAHSTWKFVFPHMLGVRGMVAQRHPDGPSIVAPDVHTSGLSIPFHVWLASALPPNDYFEL